MAMKLVMQNKFMRDFEILADLYKNEKSDVDSLLIFSSLTTKETSCTDSSSQEIFKNHSLKNNIKIERNKALKDLLLHSGRFM